MFFNGHGTFRKENWSIIEREEMIWVIGMLGWMYNMLHCLWCCLLLAPCLVCLIILFVQLGML